MITKFDKFLNEGIRDKMTGKSTEEVIKTVERASEPFTRSSLNTYIDPKEVCEILDETMNNLYVIWLENIDDEEVEEFPILDGVVDRYTETPMIERNLRGDDDYNDEEDSWLFYPELKLAYMEPYDLQYPCAWIYSKPKMMEYIDEYVR